MENQFDALREKLEAEEWPSLYLFKFILPSDNQKTALLTGLFDIESDISIRSSSNGKYASISVKEVMLNVDAVIEIYKKAAQIKGVIVI